MLQQPVKFFLLVSILAVAAVAPGCITLRKPPARPFVYSTAINIQGNLSPDQKQELKARLENQLDDSLKLKLVTIFPGIRRLDKPPVFDTNAVTHSIEFMKALLYSLGYYKDSINWKKKTDTIRIGKQQRVNVVFIVIPGKSYKFDSIAYGLEDSALQRLALARRRGALIKKGDPYSVEGISDELDRLVDIFRNQGYYKFSKDDLVAERDTVFAALINPSLDPFERIQLLQEAKRRQQNPGMNVLIKLRNLNDSSHFRKYYIRHISIYPDQDLIDDTSLVAYHVDTVRGVPIYNKYDKFKPSFIESKMAIHPGDLYRQRNFTRTYTNYSQIPAWLQTSITTEEARDSSSNLDVIIKMYTAKKLDVSVTQDFSYNTGDIVSGTNLFGTGINFGLANHNVARQGIQSSTNFRTGVELSLIESFIQTFQTSLSHTISFPRLIQPFKLKKPDSLQVAATQLNFNVGYVDRRDFYALRSLNGSWGYQFSKPGKKRNTTHSWFYSPLNVEFVSLEKRDKLNTLLASIPNLAFSFNTGLVISQVLSYNFSQLRNNKKNGFRVTVEESGGLFGLIRFLDTQANLFRFVKADVDYRHLISYKKSALAFRLYAGAGSPYGKDAEGHAEKQLPFFKSFYAGGPNSMRGWQVRQLGPGSSEYFDTVTNGPLDRFGDIQLEGNAEYRFNLGTLFGVKLKSALFTDAGNIWYRNNLGDPILDGSEFSFPRLYQDLAIDAGTSLRIDFDYFLIRFDWAYKLKNPVYYNMNNGWFHDLELTKGQLQLGVNYPF